LRSILNNVDIKRVGGIAMTLFRPWKFSAAFPVTIPQIAMIAAVEKYHAEVGKHFVCRR